MVASDQRCPAGISTMARMERGLRQCRGRGPGGLPPGGDPYRVVADCEKTRRRLGSRATRTRCFQPRCRAGPLVAFNQVTVPPDILTQVTPADTWAADRGIGLAWESTQTQATICSGVARVVTPLRTDRGSSQPHPVGGRSLPPSTRPPRAPRPFGVWLALLERSRVGSGRLLVAARLGASFL
jgi:hypothetical protein